MTMTSITDPEQERTGAENVLWNLGDLYTGSDDPAITRDLEESLSEADRFAEKYRGRVETLNAQELVTALTEAEAMQERLGGLYSFASLQWATDTANPDYGALLQRVREVGSQFSQKTLFFDLEWAAVSDEQAKVVEDPALARWKHYLETARKLRPYLLSEPEEKILSEKSLTGGGAWSRFFSETVNSIEFDWEGQKAPQSLVLRQLYNPDREVRKRAADALTAGLRPHLRPLTFVFNTVLADKASNDRLRNYPTWISARNLDNETTDAAVDALVLAVTSRYDIVARYYKIKQQLLGYETLFDYDRYAPVAEAESHYQWEEARDIVLTAFNAFSPRMAEVAGEFFEKRWIHAPVLQGKQSGAFAHPSTPARHPFVLVNYTGVGRDVMTLAHELGHGIHMYLSRPKGVFGAYTPLTTAEMASVFGEMLVFNDLMARETDPAVQLSMLASKIEDSFATVFRQISMNRFENAIHIERRTEGELSTERFNALWMDAQRSMFGESVTLREDYSIWWSYISHFIGSPGYVYAYAFGELLVLALYNRYHQEGASFVPKYLDVLAAGGADSPENILAKAGINLNDPAFWQEGLAAIETMVTQLETLVNARG